MRFAHTNIIARDWRRLAAFYVEVFDCTLKPPKRQQSGDWLENGTGVPGAALEGVHLLLPGHGDQGPTLEIYTYLQIQELAPGAANRRGFSHVAFEVTDVEETVAAVVEHGGSLAGRVTRRQVEGVGIITFVYARDPEGNLIEIQHWE